MATVEVDDISDRRRQKPSVNADVHASDETAGCVRCEEHCCADQLLGAAKAVHGGVGEDLLSSFGWGSVVFKEQAAVLFVGEEAPGDGVAPYAFVGPLPRSCTTCCDCDYAQEAYLIALHWLS